MKRKFIIISVIFLVLVIVGLLIATKSSFNFGKKYLEDIIINSDDREHSIVIKEWGTIGGTGADFYYIIESLFGERMNKIGETISKDSCYPFRDNYYILEWKDKSVVVSYFGGRQSQTIDNPDAWESKEFMFPQ